VGYVFHKSIEKVAGERAARLGEELAALTKERATLADELGSAQKRIVSLEVGGAKLEVERQAAVRGTDGLRGRCGELEGALAEKAAERDALERRLSSAEAEGVASRDNLASERDRLLELLAVSEQKATETAEALGTTSRGRDELESLLAKVEKELAVQQKAAAAAEQQRGEVGKRMDEVRAECAALEVRLSATVQKLELATADRDVALRQMVEADEERAEVSGVAIAQLEARDAELKALRPEVQRLRDALAVAMGKAEAGEEAAEVGKRLDEVRAECAALEVRLSATVQKLELTTADRDELLSAMASGEADSTEAAGLATAQLEARDAELKALRPEMQRLRDALAVAMGKAAAMDGRRAQLEEQSEAERDAALARLCDSELRTAEAEARVDQLGAQLDALAVQVQLRQRTAGQAAAVAAKQVGSLSEELRALQAEKTQLSERLEASQRVLKEAVAKAGRELERVSRQLVTARARCGRLEGAVTTTTARLAAAEAERDLLSSQVRPARPPPGGA
jgi:chromosome segregation ATPase